MKLQNLFIQSKIKELIKLEPSKWNNNNVYHLLFYINNNIFEKYKNVLFILYNNFLLEIENNQRNQELTFDLENLYEIKDYLLKNENIDLKKKLDELEKEKKIKELDNVNNVNNIDNVDKLDKLDDLDNLDDLDIVDDLDNVDDLDQLNKLNELENKIKNKINKIKTNKYNKLNKTKYSIKINNLNDKELFINKELINENNCKYYTELFFGIGLIIIILIIKNIYKLFNNFIDSDFLYHDFIDENKLLNENFLKNFLDIKTKNKIKEFFFSE